MRYIKRSGGEVATAIFIVIVLVFILFALPFAFISMVQEIAAMK